MNIACHIRAKNVKEVESVRRVRRVANGHENLQPVKSKEEARERGRAGGIRSGEVRREKKLFKEAIEKKLGINIDSMIDAMIEQSNKGNVQAITFLRDTIGEKPIDKVQGTIVSYEDSLKAVDGDEY